MLFEKAGLHDRAAQMYIKLKSWNKVAELLPQVQSLKIHSQYAKVGGALRGLQVHSSVFKPRCTETWADID